jgi:hypothetical protein
VIAALVLVLAAAPPFGPGETITMKVTYARLRAGRAVMTVGEGTRDGRPAWTIEQRVTSEGFFAWLFRYKVDNLLRAWWEPATGCSYGVEKRLRQGRFARDQVIRIDPRGRVETTIAGMGGPVALDVEPCVLDVLSAFYVARARYVPGQPLYVPVFDNGRRFDLVFRELGHTRLDLPAPLGDDTPVRIVEPIVPAGSGLFAQEGRLIVWVTDDDRRIPVRAQSKVAVGSVTVEIEGYEPGGSSDRTRSR